MTVEDETRAAAYRVQAAERIRRKRELERALRGNTGAAEAVRAAWRPVEPGQAVPLVWEGR